jgi:hypothetical protein
LERSPALSSPEEIAEDARDERMFILVSWRERGSKPVTAYSLNVLVAVTGSETPGGHKPRTAFSWLDHRSSTW